MRSNDMYCCIPAPDIAIHMNCDTYIAVNLKALCIGDYDEFIFTIKNYNYIDSSYVFIYKACKADMDTNGEVIFNIDPDTSKNIKPGAFYTCTVLTNALNYQEASEYRKITSNGKINLEYGAYDLALSVPEEPQSPFMEVLAARVELTNEDSVCAAKGTIIDFSIEEHTEVDLGGLPNV